MVDSLELKSALEHLVSGISTEGDRQLVQDSLLSGRIVYAAGERNVAIGGDAAGAIIITGDQAQVKVDLSDAVYQKLQERLFPQPAGLPPPFPELIFIGRDQAVRDVKRLLLPSEHGLPSVSVAIVRGWPGVGKTTLVGVLSRDPDIVKNFPDGVLWTSLDQKPALTSILAGWGRALGVGDLLRIPTADESAQTIRSSLGNKRMLLIVDDVWEAEHGAVFLKAKAGNCALLITTRLPAVAELLAKDDWIYYLDVLAEDDALRA